MTRDLYQYTLPSKRQVRVKVLTPTEKDVATKVAAKVAGMDASVVDFRLSAIRECVYAMIHQVMTDEEKWLSFESDMYDTYFTAKDDEILSGLYRRLHEVSSEDLEAIAGKAQMVSMG